MVRKQLPDFWRCYYKFFVLRVEVPVVVKGQQWKGGRGKLISAAKCYDSDISHVVPQIASEHCFEVIFRDG